MYDKNFKFDSTEFLKAVTWCMNNGFEGELLPCHDGLQYCYPTKKKSEFDFIIHSYSYGGYDGLLEEMGLRDDDVTGYLTAEKLIKLIKEKYNKE